MITYLCKEGYLQCASLTPRNNPSTKHINRWFLSRFRVFCSLVIPKWIDESKVTVMSDIYITISQWKCFEIIWWHSNKLFTFNLCKCRKGRSLYDNSLSRIANIPWNIGFVTRLYLYRINPMQLTNKKSYLIIVSPHLLQLLPPTYIFGKAKFYFHIILGLAPSMW